MAEGPFIRDLFMTGQQTNESLVNIAFGKLDFVNFKRWYVVSEPTLTGRRPQLALQGS